MKKILSLFIVLMLALTVSLSAASAVTLDKNHNYDVDNKADREFYSQCENICQENGYDNTVAGWMWDGESYVLKHFMNGYDTSVTGTQNVADWMSDPAIDGVIINHEHFYDGGAFGQIDVGEHKIKTLAMCADDPQVPEFGVVAAGIALIGAVAIFAFKRKN